MKINGPAKKRLKPNVQQNQNGQTNQQQNGQNNQNQQQKVNGVRKQQKVSNKNPNAINQAYTIFRQAIGYSMRVYTDFIKFRHAALDGLHKLLTTAKKEENNQQQNNDQNNQQNNG